MDFSVLMIAMFAKSLQSCLLFAIPWTVATSLLCPLDSPGKNAGVGCHAFLQGIFLTQELNPGLLHCRQILYHLSYRRRIQLPSSY